MTKMERLHWIGYLLDGEIGETENHKGCGDILPVYASGAKALVYLRSVVSGNGHRIHKQFGWVLEQLEGLFEYYCSFASNAYENDNEFVTLASVLAEILPELYAISPDELRSLGFIS